MKRRIKYIPLVTIMDFWKKGHTCEGDKGGSFNLNLYLAYCQARENYEKKI